MHAQLLGHQPENASNKHEQINNLIAGLSRSCLEELIHCVLRHHILSSLSPPGTYFLQVTDCICSPRCSISPTSPLFVTFWFAAYPGGSTSGVQPQPSFHDTRRLDVYSLMCSVIFLYTVVCGRSPPCCTWRFSSIPRATRKSLDLEDPFA